MCSFCVFDKKDEKSQDSRVKRILDTKNARAMIAYRKRHREQSKVKIVKGVVVGSMNFDCSEIFY